MEDIGAWIEANPELAMKHATGRIIFAPPGSGKSHFVEQLPYPKEFTDADEVLGDDGLKVHPETWHDQDHSPEEEREHYLLCEEYLKDMRSRGLWVVTSLFENMDPDAIVLLPVSEHKKYVALREDLQWSNVERIRDLLSQKKNVPLYTSWKAMARTMRFMSSGAVDY